MSTTMEVRPRVRVPARTELLASTAVTTVQFRGIGAGAKKPATADDEDVHAEQPPAEQPEDGNRKTKKKKAKATPATDEDTDNEEDDDPDEDGDDDDDNKETDRREAAASSPARAARLREKGRIAAILESPAAAANLDYAVHVALSTDLPRHEAIALIERAPKPNARGGLHDRMAEFGNLRPGAGAPPAPKGQAAIDASWEKAASAVGVPLIKR